MSAARNPSRAHLWMDTLGDWSWPGQGGAAAVEVLPPAWVPAFPPAREPLAAPSAPAAGRRRRLILAVLLSALAAVSAALAARGQLGAEALLGVGSHPAAVAAPTQPTPAPAPLPTLAPMSTAP